MKFIVWRESFLCISFYVYCVTVYIDRFIIVQVLYMCIIIRCIYTVVGIVREFGSSPTYMFVYDFIFSETMFCVYGVTMCTNRFVVKIYMKCVDIILCYSCNVHVIFYNMYCIKIIYKIITNLS